MDLFVIYNNMSIFAIYNNMSIFATICVEKNLKIFVNLLKIIPQLVGNSAKGIKNPQANRQSLAWHRLVLLCPGYA
jgi:hypothetical protein